MHRRDALEALTESSAAAWQGTETLKQKICEAVDRRRNDIIPIGESIMDTPELGFKERQTAERVQQADRKRIGRK